MTKSMELKFVLFLLPLLVVAAHGLASNAVSVTVTIIYFFLFVKKSN